jgi:hypothetical protein
LVDFAKVSTDGSFIAQAAKVDGYMVSYYCSLNGELNHAGRDERNVSPYGSALLEVFGCYFIALVIQCGLVWLTWEHWGNANFGDYRCVPRWDEFGAL